MKTSFQRCRAQSLRVWIILLLLIKARAVAMQSCPADAVSLPEAQSIPARGPLLRTKLEMNSRTTDITAPPMQITCRQTFDTSGQ